jgi:hypothetical protein
VAENNNLFEALGLKTTAAQFNNSLPQSTTDKGKNQETKKQVVKIRIHQSISLIVMIKEVVMMTLNLMTCHNP